MTKEVKKKEKTAVFKLGDASVKTYAYRIASNLIYDNLRKKYSKAKGDDAAEVEKPVTDEDVELLTAMQQQGKISYLKKMFYTDPTTHSFDSIAAPQDFDVRFFENGDVVSLLLAKLAEENPDYETTIRLFYYADLSYQEIADSGTTNGKTEGTCKKNGSLAKKRLIEIARQYGLFDSLD